MATMTYPESHIPSRMSGTKRARLESSASWNIASLLREAAKTRDYVEMLPDFLHPAFISKKIADRDNTLDAYASALCPSGLHWAHEIAGLHALRGVLHILVLAAHDGLKSSMLAPYQGVSAGPAHIAALITWLQDLDLKVRTEAVLTIANDASGISKNRGAMVRMAFARLFSLDAKGQDSALEFAGRRVEYLMPPHYERRALPGALAADGKPTFVYALPKFARRCGLLDLGPAA